MPTGIHLIAVIALLTASAASTASTTAVPASPPAHGLRAAFEQAWGHHPHARAAPERDQAQAALQRAATSWLAAQPAISLSTETDRLHRDRGEQEQGVALSLPVRWPSQRDSGLAQAAQTALWRDAELARARWELAGAVRQAWWQCQRTAVQAMLAARQEAHAQTLADDVARRVAAGDLARADGHQARMAQARAAAEAAQAQAEQAAARAQLQALLGEGVLRAAQVCDTVSPPSPATPLQAVLDPEPWPDPAVDTVSANHAVENAHPAWASWQARAALSERATAYAAAQARGEPEVTLGWLHQREQHGERPRQAVALALRLPLGRAPASQAAVAEARAEAALAAAEGEPLRQRLQADWLSAQARHAAATAQLAAAQRRAALARDTLGFIERAFRAGEADLPTLLRITHEAFEAEQHAALAHIDLAAARSAIRQAAGLLPP